jgi:hypothetical protein
MFCWPEHRDISVQKEPTGCTVYFLFISVINPYMFRAGKLLIIRRYDSVYRHTAVGICHAFMSTGCWQDVRKANFCVGENIRTEYPWVHWIPPFLSQLFPTANSCNNCVYSSQLLYSTCFGWQFHPSSGVHMLYMASGRQVYLCCNFVSIMVVLSL